MNRLPKTLTKRQQDMLRRFLHMAANELLEIATTPKLPDQWYETSTTTYAHAAVRGLYDQMAADGLLPPREA